MDLDASSPSGQQPGAGELVVLAPQQPLKAEEDEQKAMAAALKDEEEGGEPSGRLTSSRMGNVSCTDSTRMCVSLLAEGSSVRYDCSMQVGSRAWGGGALAGGDCGDSVACAGGQRLQHHISRGRQSHGRRAAGTSGSAAEGEAPEALLPAPPAAFTRLPALPGVLP